MSNRGSPFIINCIGPFSKIFSSTDRIGEFDRFRTCDHQTHILTLYLLSYKLHIATLNGFEPSPPDPVSVMLPFFAHHRQMPHIYTTE